MEPKFKLNQTVYTAGSKDYYAIVGVFQDIFTAQQQLPELNFLNIWERIKHKSITDDELTVGSLINQPLYALYNLRNNEYGFWAIETDLTWISDTPELPTTHE